MSHVSSKKEISNVTAYGLFVEHYQKYQLI